MTAIRPGFTAEYPSLDWAECPYPLYDALREEHPVYEVPSRPGEYLVTRHEDVMFVLRHPELFSNQTDDQFSAGRATAKVASALGVDPPQHTVQRKLIVRPFTPGRLRAKVPMIQGVVDELIDAFIARGSAEFVTEFANPLPIYVTCGLMGLPRADIQWLHEWGQLEGTGTRYRTAEERGVQLKRSQAMVRYLEAALRARYADPTGDALSEIVQLQVDRDGELDMPYLIAESALLLAGGIVTSAHMIASAMVLLLDYPAQMAALRAEPAHIPRMLEESLRIESPVQWQPRRVVTDTEISGVPVPAGANVLLVFAAANRDHAVFGCPVEFDPRRANVKSHVAFGYGAHFCLGAPLARLEVKLAFETLVRRTSEIRWAPDGEREHIESVTFRGPRSVRIEFS